MAHGSGTGVADMVASVVQEMFFDPVGKIF